MPESVTDRCTKAHEYVFLLTKSARYFYDADAIREEGSGVGGGAAFGSVSNENEAKAAGAQARRFDRPDYATRNRRSVWTVPIHSYAKAHFATFPPALIEPCILAGTSNEGCCPTCGAPWKRVVEKTRTFESGSGKSGNPITGKQDAVHGGGDTLDVRRGPCVETKTTGWEPTCSCTVHSIQCRDCPPGPNGVVLGTDACKCGPRPPVPCTVLDPFLGAGTTALVAKQNGRRCIGIELNPEYVPMAVERIQQEMLF